jgi:hypothetical protein
VILIRLVNAWKGGTRKTKLIFRCIFNNKNFQGSMCDKESRKTPSTADHFQMDFGGSLRGSG